EHALGVLAHLVQGPGQLDAAGLAAAAGVDLRLDHPEVAVDGLGGLDRLLWRAGDAPGGNGNAVVGEQLLGLVFVEVHRSSSCGWGACRRRHEAAPHCTPLESTSCTSINV